MSECEGKNEMRASQIVAAIGIASASALLPEVAAAATPFAAVNTALNVIPTAVMGAGGVMAVLGFGKALITWGADGHGDAIGKGVKAGIGGSGAVGVGAIANQVVGSSQAFSLESVHNAASTAADIMMTTGGWF